ncbi:predicted protein [Plenodomus lingam JN3]|uniref:Predicted protein n=1 Tax=Leptosphaeria maculans (strain JN3 / isolate v23.1.3 / race Av1-4-5-6-7-8) TaxID=985895 RepID=E4ZSQ1_LEPMJ|nr:predicted protein [Plenodomus lingam JN3]CBX94431.1 predicted protein [Plenodomus lingam JN3]
MASLSKGDGGRVWLLWLDDAITSRFTALPSPGTGPGG